MRGWCLEVWGEYACFTRPEMKAERVSYDVMTPSAARAIFEAILWKPAIRWHITKIEVLNPIKWISIRRNELDRKASLPTTKQMSGLPGPPMGIAVSERIQRAGLFLKNTRYRIHGYFEFIPPVERAANRPYEIEYWADEQERADIVRLDENEAKYAAMFERRARKGQCFHRPYLGCREFACDFRLIRNPELESAQPISETRDLGFMLYDMNYEHNPEDPTPLFFRAYMNNGIVNTDRRQIEVRG
ncbi:type I-C CRISPR-associated protein Cas5c [Paenibacillus xylaniclasticus]|uniref:type I-C CRISPR-associated protein Cas5c n=1 Tax=Paenibacillus xylaniclasticus TaxID=588083 RepID=UPI001757B81E|nr:MULTISPECIES: type I-C CRISPR-associated protein Cas5c [Paenibacillus]GFN33931.1 type I-C CRISPR-associated protein Cas5 [Paenibacillus curdlanolyticus]